MLKTFKVFTYSSMIFVSLFLGRALAQEATISNDSSMDTQPQEIVQETMRGLILEVVDEGSRDVYGQQQKYAVYKVRITHGSKKGEEVDVLTGLYEESEPFVPGDKILILYSKDSTGQEAFYITDYTRINPLVFLVVTFILFTILVAKRWGIAVLLSLIFSLAIVMRFVLPQIAKGTNPILISILGALVILPVIFYLPHGINRKTTIALISAVISVVFVGILATIFMAVAKITGFGSEEALFLQYAKGGIVNIKGLLLAGIVLGSLGILESITLSQASVVFELKKSQEKLDATETFHTSLALGHDHITASINTLAFLYTGATLPMLVLLVENPVTTFEIVNSEFLAEEILRTLVSGIGLILSVPLVTLLCAVYYKKEN